MRWSRSNEWDLLSGVGSYGWIGLARRSGGRSKSAIQSKLHRLCGGGITRGTYSLAQVQKMTGYSRSQLRRAGKALGQRWNRTAKGRTHPFLITGEQVDELTEWLRTDYWSAKSGLYGCVNCGTQSAPHYSFGCCLCCYKRLRRIAESFGLPFTARRLLAALPADLPQTLCTVRHNLEVGRAPTRRQLEALCSYTKP